MKSNVIKSNLGVLLSSVLVLPLILLGAITIATTAQMFFTLVVIPALALMACNIAMTNEYVIDQY